MTDSCKPAVTVAASTTVITVGGGTPQMVVSGGAPVVLTLRQSTVVVDAPAAPALVIEVCRQGPEGPPGAQGPPGFGAIIAETDDFLVPGSAVYAKNNGHFGLAQADTLPQARFVGFSRVTTAPTFAAEVVSGGPLELSAAEWYAVTGQIGGLTPGSPYFLSVTTAGSITVIPPSLQFSVKVGVAITSTILDVDPRNPIKL